MPTLRKLTQEEARALDAKPLGQRARIAAEYDRYLVDFAPGDYGEVQLDAADNRLTVRNRLQAAAARRGLALTFRRTTGPKLRFRVEATVDGAQNNAGSAPAQPEPPLMAEVVQPKPSEVESRETPAAGAPKRRGRPPRAEAVQEAPAVEKSGAGVSRGR